MNLGFQIQKSNVEIRVSVLEIPCVPIFRQNGQLWNFWSNFAKKGMDFYLEVHSTNVEKKSACWRHHMCQFLGKTDNFHFFGPNLPKIYFRLEIQKTNVEIRISILEIRSHLCQFLSKEDNFNFFDPNLGVFGWEFQKSKSGFRISCSNF